MVLAEDSYYDKLFSLAETQQGCFMSQQAYDLGFSPQLLSQYLSRGKVTMLMRGIYSLKNFPTLLRDQQDLVVAWLWSNQRGIISHETALQMHDLSDTFPSRLHITLPTGLQHIKKKKPLGLSAHYANIAEFEMQWIGSVPVTNVARTINDVAMGNGDAVQIEKAINQAIKRNLISAIDVYLAVNYAAGNL